MRLLVLPEDLRPKLKDPLGRLCQGNGLECVKAMDPELSAARKIAAVGDMTAFYLLRADIRPDVIIVDHKTKRALIPDHVRKSLVQDSYKTVEVANPPATLTGDLMDLIKDALSRDERVKIEVDGEEDLATLPAILYAPLGSVVVYGQPGEGMVTVIVTPAKKEQIKSLMDKMIVEE